MTLPLHIRHPVFLAPEQTHGCKHGIQLPSAGLGFLGPQRGDSEFKAGKVLKAELPALMGAAEEA